MTTSEIQPLLGKHVIVTGGSRGIGAAIAVALARDGARLTLMSRGTHALEEAAAEVRQETTAECEAVACDVSDPLSVHQAFGVARERFGTPYALINNAGQGASATVVDTTPELWNRLLAANLSSVLYCIQQVLPGMQAKREGRIINVASTAGLTGYNRSAAYCASKHGVIGLTRAIAVETAKFGVTVNAVCPGYTDTGMAHDAIQNLVRDAHKTEAEARAMLVRKSPRGELTAPEEVANAVCWLCSAGATAITGQAIAVAGGEVM